MFTYLYLRVCLPMFVHVQINVWVYVWIFVPGNQNLQLQIFYLIYFMPSVIFLHLLFLGSHGTKIVFTPSHLTSTHMRHTLPLNLLLLPIISLPCHFHSLYSFIYIPHFFFLLCAHIMKWPQNMFTSPAPSLLSIHTTFAIELKFQLAFFNFYTIHPCSHLVYLLLFPFPFPIHCQLPICDNYGKKWADLSLR